MGTGQVSCERASPPLFIFGQRHGERGSIACLLMLGCKGLATGFPPVHGLLRRHEKLAVGPDDPGLVLAFCLVVALLLILEDGLCLLALGAG